MLSEETLTLELLKIAPTLDALRDAFSVLSGEVNKTSLCVLQIKDAVDKSHEALVESIAKNDRRIESIAASIEEAHDKLAESIGKNAQMDNLAHFVEFCFGEPGSRESLFTAIGVVREYLTASCLFRHEDVDVFFATSKRNAFQRKKTP